MTLTPGDPLHRHDPLNDSGWDAKLESCPGASFFHGAPWARVLHGTYGYTPAYFATAGTAAPPMLLPVMEVRSWLTGSRGITLPFTDECDALCPGPEAFHAIFRQLLSFAQPRRWKYYELRGSRFLGGAISPSVSFFGHQLDLGRDATALFNGFDSAVRRAIRKAQQEGVTVEFSQDLSAVRTFYDLLCRTRHRHGLPPQPFRFFENIHRHVLQAGIGRVALARFRGTPVAGAVFFHFRKNALYKFAASDETFQTLRGNNLVIWRAMEDYVKNGFSVLDFGRTSLSNAGLRRFKLSWGSLERKIDYVRYGRKENGFVTSTDEAHNRWHNSLFRALPGGLSRLIGAVAYKHLA